MDETRLLPGSVGGAARKSDVGDVFGDVFGMVAEGRVGDGPAERSHADKRG